MLQLSKNEMTLDCFILRSSSFFTNSDHPQSRVISLLSWYLTSFFIPLFLRTRLGFSKLLPSILIFLCPHRFLVTLRSVSGIRLPRSPHLIITQGFGLPLHWSVPPSLFVITLYIRKACFSTPHFTQTYHLQFIHIGENTLIPLTCFFFSGRIKVLGRFSAPRFFISFFRSAMYRA